MYNNIVELDEAKKKKMIEFLKDFNEFVQIKGYDLDIVGNGLITCLANLANKSNNLDQIIYMLRVSYNLYKENEGVK